MAHTNTAFVAAKNGTVGTSVIALGTSPFDFSTANLMRAYEATVVANTNGVVVTWEGTNPTTTLGVPIAAGEHLVVRGDVARIKMISKDTSNATVTVILGG
jgi:hypothetical protein